MSRPTRAFLALLASSTTTLPAQQGVVQLAPANATSAIEFSELIGIRELRDGRVLVSDRKENWLAVVSFEDGSMKQIGRVGQGPGEFQGPLALFALGGDSTIAAEAVSRRWLVLVGDSVVATLPPDDPAVQRVSLWPSGIDRFGHVLSREFSRALSDGDSQPVVLIDRASGSVEPTGKLKLGVRRAPARTVNDPVLGKGVRYGRIPLNVGDVPLLLPDGWLAITRADPYRVDWRSPDGKWTIGASITTPDIPMNAIERQAYASRNTWARNATDWPATLPPFDTPSPPTFYSTPDGWLVIKRLPSARDKSQLYDLVDKTGRRRAQLAMRLNEAIAGFGAASVYVIATDDDGIQRLRRHPYTQAAIRP